MESTNYKIFEIKDTEVTGYVAVGFVDSADDNPPMNARKIIGKTAIVKVEPYETSEMAGKGIYVFSADAKVSERRLLNLGRGKLKPLPEITFVKMFEVKM